MSVWRKRSDAGYAIHVGGTMGTGAPWEQIRVGGYCMPGRRLFGRSIDRSILEIGFHSRVIAKVQKFGFARSIRRL